MKKMRLVSLLFGLFATSCVGATQFESVIDAMAIKASDGHTNNSWEDVARIKGVKWRWPYYESGAHDGTMEGKAKYGRDKNPNIGQTNILVNGTRTMISSIIISLANKPADVSVFGKGKTSKIKTTCDDDSFTNTVAFYKFVKPGHKPLFISYQSSWGAGGDSGGVQFEIAYTINNVLSIYPDPCKALE